MAPASPATLDYMCRYTAGFSGGPSGCDARRRRPLVEHGRVPRAASTARSAVNVAVPGAQRQRPHGGDGPGHAAADGRRAARACGGWSARAMEQGAVGLSSGPRLHPQPLRRGPRSWPRCARRSPRSAASTSRTCAATTPRASSARWTRSSASAGRPAWPVHISHFNSRADLVLPQLDDGRAARRRRDLRPVLLPGRQHHPGHDRPAAVGAGGRHRRRRWPGCATRRVWPRLREWFAAPACPWRRVRHQLRRGPGIAARYEGHDAAGGGRQRERASGWASSSATCCWRPRWRSAASCRTAQRDEEDVAALMRHPAMMAGSDGIFTGSRPHPRGCGCFARYLTTCGGHLDAGEAVQQLAATRPGASG